ncbi:MAG: hypothetical protein H8E18_09620 [FCB group bacterium]|nr:hypothetical protein [FCB group bacterium]
MNTKRLIIDNIEQLNPTMLKYGIILSETHTEVKSQQGHDVPVESYLWYNFPLDNQPPTFVAYYREKLGITNENDALGEISIWNHEFYNRGINVVSFNKMIPIEDKLFGVLATNSPNRSIVMMNSAMRPKDYWTVEAGSGGYAWQYLDPRSRATDTKLKDYFGLNKYQRDRFQNQW